MPDERVVRLEEQLKAAVDRTSEIAGTLRDFRKESSEQHRQLEQKIDEAIQSIADDKETAADRKRVVAIAFGAPTFTFLMGILYKLVGS